MFSLIAHPAQSVTQLAFSPRERNELLVSSWDCTLRLYDVASNQPKATHTYNAPILDCCYDASGSYAFAAGLDCAVHRINLERGVRDPLALACQEKGISSLAYNATLTQLFSGSWDGSLGILDPRMVTGRGLIGRLSLGEGQIYSISTSGTSLVAATASKKLVLFDARYMSAPLEVRLSPLKTQLRKVAMHPDARSFVVGSTEGRCAIEYVDSGSTELQSLKYAFKCHRTEDVCYPVNAIAYHPLGTFATGGSDGAVYVWDGFRRKRQLALPPFPQPVSALAFNSDGGLLAIASSRTFEHGEEGDPNNNNIYVRVMQEAEIKPKTDKNAK
jgi:cell cycle arrest protein BUB3